MRKLLLVLLLGFTPIQNNLMSQLNDAASYFPLKPGNKWVYSYYSTQFGQSGRFSRQVTSTMNANGHIYYYYIINYVRVDSTNANVFYHNPNGCTWSPGESMNDSLASRLNDTIRYGCGTYYKVLSDTNQRMLFGSMRRTKNFRLGNNGIIYAKNFGIMEFYSQSGNMFYVENLAGCVIDGVVYGDTSTLVAVNQISSETPLQFSLSQNYPNPFNPMTNIKFEIPKSVFGKLTVYDLLGKEIQTLVNEQFLLGTYKVDFDGSSLPSGVYYYKLEAANYTETKKMVLIK